MRVVVDLLTSLAGKRSVMTAETLADASTGTYVFMLLLGLVWGLWPLAVITNFRGYRERHLERALRGQNRLRRLPPYRFLKSDPEGDRRFASFMQLFVATVFLLVAVVLVVVAVVRLARRLSGG
jgi:hypothetical protein